MVILLLLQGSAHLPAVHRTTVAYEITRTLDYTPIPRRVTLAPQPVRTVTYD